MLGYLPTDILFREANSFPRATLSENRELWGTNNVQEQNNIQVYFQSQMEAIVFIIP